MMFTLGSVACMGACSQAPVMRIGEQTFGYSHPTDAQGHPQAHGRDRRAKD